MARTYRNVRKLTQHQKAHDLRRIQMRNQHVGYMATERTCDGFLPTPRHLHGGVAHTSHGRAAVKKAEHGWI